MRIWFVLVATLVVAGGCSKDDGVFPILVGGGPTFGGNGGTDATATGSGDAGPTIDGLVCLLTDMRKLTTCATSGVGALNVTLDGVTAVTADDGTFTIAAPAGTNLQWSVVDPLVNNPSVIPSLMSFSAVAVIPTIKTDNYHSLQFSNGVVDVMGEGAIVARVLQNGVALPGAIATTNPPPAGGQPFYDSSSSATVWNQSSTGPNGTLWIPALTAGASTTLTVTPNGGTAVDIANLPIGDESITYVTVDVP